MESRLVHRDIVGLTQHDRAGLGSRHLSLFQNTLEKERSEMIITELRRDEGEHRQTRAIGLLPYSDKDK
jgi:hypothetical protein